MVNIRNTKRFRELAGVLRGEAGRCGVMLVAGEAEDLLAGRVDVIATQLGVTQRTAIDNYLSAELMTQLARTLSTHAEAYREVVRQAEPVLLLAANAGRVVAALGMVLKLAAAHLDKTPASAASIVNDGADALVGFGAALGAAGDQAEIELGGQTLVWTRAVLTRAIGLIRDGQWDCPCGTSHEQETSCGLPETLTGDLNLVGGWLPSGENR